METTEANSSLSSEGLTTGTWACPDGSLLKSILEHGTGVDKPKEGSRCRILAEVDLEKELEMGPPFNFVLNKWTEVVLGESDTPWADAVDKCLETMLEGEVCRVVVAPLCSFGSLPELTFVLHLAVFTPSKDSWMMVFEEKWELVVRYKCRGTANFQGGNLFGAALCYGRAFRLLLSLACHEVPTAMAEEYNRTKVTLHTNLAACQLRLGQFENAVQNCTKALVHEPCSIKALYRRGTAYGALNEFEKAETDLQEVLQHEPSNRAALRELKRLAEKAREQEAKMAHAMHKLFL